MKAGALLFMLALSILPVLAIPLQKENNPKRIAQAIEQNNTDFLEYYVTKENINDCYVLDNSVYNLLAMSIKQKAEYSFKMLLEHADIERTCTGTTALMYAVQYGQIDMVIDLINKGADIDVEINGNTAMAYAKKYEQQEILEYLQAKRP